MNENIDLTKILKDCPKGFRLYTPLFGEVEFQGINYRKLYAIYTYDSCDRLVAFTYEGFYYANKDAECLLFPSKDQRDWSKFDAPWHKKEKFDPKTLKPFDKVLVHDSGTTWRCSFFSHIENSGYVFPYATNGGHSAYCIPYNDDTKHLVGTTEEAPEYYEYWED